MNSQRDESIDEFDDESSDSFEYGDEMLEDSDLVGWQSEAETPLDCVVDRTILGELEDFSPPHSVLEFIKEQIIDIGFSMDSTDGQLLFLTAASHFLGPLSEAENNPYFACYFCENQFDAIADERLFQLFRRVQSGKIPLKEMYRCPECGGQINVRQCGKTSDRHLPWEHYAHGIDFDIYDEGEDTDES